MTTCIGTYLWLRDLDPFILREMGICYVGYEDHPQHSMVRIRIKAAPGFTVDNVSNEIQQALVKKDNYLCAICMQPFVAGHLSF
jgi:DNA-directed RNA polymerase subunit L